MKHLLLTILLFTALMACAQNRNIDWQADIDYLKTGLKNYTIPTREMYIKDLDCFEKSGVPPYYCSSDFDGNGSQDYALLLRDSSNQVYLYAFLTDNNSFKTVLVDSFDLFNGKIETIISVAQKGKWISAVDETEVQNDGITVDLIEESLGWSYYYNNKKFIRFLYD